MVIKEKDKFKTTFSAPKACKQWNAMPFRLENAPSIFQRVMDDVIKPYFDSLIVYNNDVHVF